MTAGSITPLTHSWAADQVEAEIRDLSVELFQTYLRAATDSINLYGMAHLGDRALLENAVTADGLAILSDTAEQRLNFLYRSWKARNPRRGLHFLESYLRAIFGESYAVAQMWQRKSAPYPTALFSLADLQGPGANLNDYYLTSRVNVDIDTPVVPDEIVKAVRDSLAARLVIQIRVAMWSRAELAVAHTMQAGAFIRMQMDDQMPDQVEFLTSWPYPALSADDSTMGGGVSSARYWPVIDGQEPEMVGGFSAEITGGILKDVVKTISMAEPEMVGGFSAEITGGILKDAVKPYDSRPFDTESMTITATIIGGTLDVTEIPYDQRTFDTESMTITATIIGGSVA